MITQKSTTKKPRPRVRLKLFNSVSANPTITSVVTGLVTVASVISQLFAVVASLNPLV